MNATGTPSDPACACGHVMTAHWSRGCRECACENTDRMVWYGLS